MVHEKAPFGEARWRVYVLRSEATGKKYIGLSCDVAKRLEQHNSHVSRYTKNRGPWTLEWQSDEMTLGEARKAENALKRQKGGAGYDALKRRLEKSRTR